MKFIYIIIAHEEPALVSRMVQRLDGPESRFLIHVDKKTKPDIFRRYQEAFKGKTNVELLARMEVYWGDFSIVQVELNAMAFIREKNFDFDYVLLLSGTHYPIKSKQAIQEYFEKNKGHLFLEYWKLPTSMHHWDMEEGGMGRLCYWHLMRLPFLEHLMYWRLRPFLKKIGLNGIIQRRYVFDLQPYGGWQWWCLDKEAVEYILEFVSTHQKFVSFFRFTLVPDETFIHTVLLNSSQKDRIINDNLVYSRWPSEKFPHPCPLSRQELGLMAGSEKLFARKLDYAADPGFFDAIDHACHREGAQDD